jgi:cell wall-associated NlpC family hydrolase
MEFFQILDCSSTLGTCCSDYGLVSILDITRKIFELIQLVTPILLILAATIQFVQLTINPELKGGFRKVLNKFIAAGIIFMLPVLVDAILTTVPEDINVAACWQQAKVVSEVNRTMSNNYVSVYEDREASPIVVDPSKYEKGNDRPTPTPGASGPNQGSVGAGTGEGSATGKAIVAYASKYIGKPYLYGGSWNGEDPYTATDCSGFVRGVYLHFGIDLPHGTGMMWRSTSKYTLVSSGNIKAGDLAMYDGHVALLTGNGNEIIHAKGKKWGVVKDADFSRSSSHGFLGIMRINGVN